MTPQLPIHESFLQTVASPELQDLAVDALELTLDSVIHSDVLERLPVVGSVVKAYGAAKNIRERFTLIKLYRFFERLGNMPHDEREEVTEQIRRNPAEARKIGEAFIVWLDRLDEEYKADLLARVFELYARGEIDFDRASRFATVIDRGHVPYLRRIGSDTRGYLSTYPHGPAVYSEDVRSHLLALGLLTVRANLQDLDRQLDRDRRREDISLVRFELNEDGRIFKEYVMDPSLPI